MEKQSTHTLTDYNQLNEALLTSWLRLSTSINNSRFVSEMTYNESLVCNVLYKHQLESPDVPLTATNLCQVTKILKSQMNRILNQLEKKKMITRTRSTKDKRQVHVSFNLEQAKAYETQHKKILSILDIIIRELGHDKVIDAIQFFDKVSEIGDRLILEKERKND